MKFTLATLCFVCVVTSSTDAASRDPAPAEWQPLECQVSSLHHSDSDGDLGQAGHSYMFPTLALDWAEAVAECEVGGVS